MTRRSAGGAPDQRRLSLAPEPDQGGADAACATSEPDQDQLRADVRHLIDQGLSNRAIASRLPVSKDTVGRWRKKWSEPVSQEPPVDEPADEPATSPEPTGAPPGAPGTMEAAPQLAVTLTGDLRDDLAVLTAGGLSEQDAIACAVQFIANAVRGAWDYGICPRPLLPTLRIRAYHPHHQPPAGGPRE